MERASKTGRAWAAAVSLAWVLAVQVSQCRIDLNLGDEGMLWYGVQRTAAGEWAIRDFQAYDPGRYLLLAGWGKVVASDGIVALRLGLAVVAWTALWAGATLVLRATGSRTVAVIACGVLAVWMGPRHKLVDAAAAVWVTGALAMLVERPSRWRHFWVGVVVGLVWLAGMNHAAYALLATGIVVVASVGSGPGFGRRVLWVAVGVVVGAVPMLAVLTFVPHYATAYWHLAILPLIHAGATNLTVPVPWPWTATTPGGVATGLGFVLLPAVVATAIVAQAVRRRVADQPVLLAATATAAVWGHHAFARADLSHLSQAIGPTVIVAAVLPLAVRWRRAAMAGLWPPVVVVTLWTLPAVTPTFNARLTAADPGSWQAVGGERLYLPAGVAERCRAGADVSSRTPAGGTDLFVPYVPGLYAVTRRRCPMYESYPLAPATADEQRRAVDGIDRGGVAWGLYWADRIDGRDDLGFANTDPVVWRYVTDHYEPAGKAAGATVLRRR